MSTPEYQPFYRRHLPHVQPLGAVRFVSFRLAASIPAAVRRRLLAEAESAETLVARIVDPQEPARQAYLGQKGIFGRWEWVMV